MSVQSAPDSVEMRRRFFICLLVGAAVNLAMLIAIASCNWQFLFDEGQITNPDARHYITIAKNLLGHGVFSRSPEPPFVPDLLRTPGFPLLIAMFWAIGGLGAVYFGTVVLHIVNCGLVFILTNRLFGSFAACCAGMLLATDLMIVSYNFSAMAETPFVTFLLSALILLTLFEVRTNGEKWQLLVAGGLMLGIATLVRPTSLYLGIVIGVPLLGRFVLNRRPLTGLLAAGMLIIASLVPVLPWIARNYLQFGIPKTTIVDTNNLVYFVGAGGFQLKRGLTLVESQAQIAAEFRIPTYAVAQNSDASNLSPIEIEGQLSAAAPHVLSKYPLHVAAACMLGVVKATISHSVEFIASICQATWRAPGTPGLIRMDGSSWRRLFDNHWILVFVFSWQVLHVLLALLAAVLGIWVALTKQSNRYASWVLFLVVGYLYATIGMFGLDAYYRCRIPVMPVLYVFSGLGLEAALRACGMGRSRTS